MSLSFKLLVNHASRDILKNFRRQISKTSTATNVNVSRQEKPQFGEPEPNKWIGFNKHNDNSFRGLSPIQTSKIVTEEEIRDFMAVFPDLVTDLTQGTHTDIPEVNKHYARLLQYNVPGGKKTRGLALVAAYKLLEKPESLNPENVRLANMLGWCVEMVKAFFLVLDDVMDGSETRRGVRCWYKNEDIGLGAINDGILIECAIYSILKQHFSQHGSYLSLLEHFQDNIMKITMGQSLDFSSSLECNLDTFTMNKYTSIAKYKTANCFFTSSVTLAMFLGNIHDPEIHRQAESVLLEMGHLYQVQDDFIDCFGDPEVTGKIGTDIQEGKCTWLVVIALQKTTPIQLKILKECYGKSDPAAVEIVKNLYLELDLPNTFARYEEETYNLISKHIQQITNGLPHEFFFKLLDQTYGRVK